MVITVSGRKGHPFIRFCKTVEEAEKLKATLIAEGYKHVEISDSNDNEKKQADAHGS